MAMWEVRRGERMVDMTEQTEVLMRAKTAGFSGAVITCSDHSHSGPGVSVRAPFSITGRPVDHWDDDDMDENDQCKGPRLVAHYVCGWISWGVV